MQDSCIVCTCPELAVFPDHENLPGGTSRGDSVHPFILLQCLNCGHLQKRLDAAWNACIRNLYEINYDLEGRHVKVNRVNGKIISRDTVVIRTLKDVLHLEKCGALLDFGCGDGLFLAAFAAAFPDWRLACYDVGDLRRDRIRSTDRIEYFSGNQFIQTDLNFDLITLSHVLEHLTDPLATLRLLGSRLTPNGRLVVRVPNLFAVYTDFFFMEHCSHFVEETLTFTLSLAGFSDYVNLPNLSAVELAVVASAFSSEPERSIRPSYSAAAVATRARECLSWSQELPDLIRSHPAENKGLFGVSGAGLWLGALLSAADFSFFVDEDVCKQGRPFSGRPVISLDDVAPGAVIFVPFNNPAAAANLGTRLRAERPDLIFVVPTSSVAVHK